MASDDPPPAKRSKILREGRLEDKVVFITAAAQGIGRASALVSYSITLHVLAVPWRES